MNKEVLNNKISQEMNDLNNENKSSLDKLKNISHVYSLIKIYEQENEYQGERRVLFEKLNDLYQDKALEGNNQIEAFNLINTMANDSLRSFKSKAPIRVKINLKATESKSPIKLDNKCSREKGLTK